MKNQNVSGKARNWDYVRANYKTCDISVADKDHLHPRAYAGQKTTMNGEDNQLVDQRFCGSHAARRGVYYGAVTSQNGTYRWTPVRDV
jgi:hypothetical protein